MIYWLICPADECPGIDKGALPPDFLSASERETYARLTFPKRRREWLLGRWTAKHLLQLSQEAYRALPLDAISVGNDSDGAPYLSLEEEGRLEMSLSISHRDDRAVVCGFARLEGQRVMIIGHRKGKSTRESVACNWGLAHPEGYRKAMHKAFLAERFRLPILMFIDTAGAYPGVGAEERGVAQSIAENIADLSTLRVPIICTILGEGASGGAPTR